MKKQTFILKNHNQKQEDIEIESSFEIDNKTLRLSFDIKGNIGNYLFDEPCKQTRKDELWKKTCFELFIAHKNRPNYHELNISTSTEWNFYTFSDYKTAMKEEKNLSEPFIHSSKMQNRYRLSVEFDFYEENFKENFTFNLAVILLDKKGIRSFYTIYRKEGKVDFHNKENWKKQK